MMAVKPHIDYTSKDYEAFRHDMLNLVPFLMPEYTDLSESDAGVMLIELSAYMGDILSYYQDRQANEVYLGTATQRRSVIDIVKKVSYKLRNATPSSSRLVVELTGPAENQFIIPRGFSISTEETDYEEPITFETVTDLIIPRGSIGTEQHENGEYKYSVEIVQGITIPNETIGSSNGQPQQRFRLQYQNVIDGSVDIYVDDGAGFELWTDVTDDEVGSTSDGKYYRRETDEDNFTYIVFGDGLNGKIPAIGSDNIVGGYRIGGGADTNVGSNAITVMNSNIAGIERVFNPIPATGGLNQETIDEARENAPKSFKTQGRAVTKDDFENLATMVPGVAKARALPDEELYNTVYVTISPVGGGMPTPKLIQDVAELLDDRKLITTNIIMEMPKYIHTRLTIDIEVTEEWSRQEAETTIIEVLKTLFALENRNFGEGMPVSKIYQHIMQAQGIYSVLIKRATAKPLIEWSRVGGNPTFDDITSLPGLNYRGKWKVEMTSPTNFKVVKVAPDGKETSAGTGTMGTTFSNSEISFKITAGTIPCVAGDYWQFDTTPYLGDLTVATHEILLFDESDLELNVTGGRE